MHVLLSNQFMVGMRVSAKATHFMHVTVPDLWDYLASIYVLSNSSGIFGKQILGLSLEVQKFYNPAN